MKRLLKGGTIISGQGRQQADLLIADGRIEAIAPTIAVEEAPDAAVMDITGKLVFPGFIDAHTHFDLPVAGTVTADGFASGSKAALAGGTTMVIDFATQYQGETLMEALANWNQKAAGKSSCDYGFHMAIADWNEQTSKDLELMMEEGVTSFKLYMTYDEMYLADKYIYQVLKRLKEVGGIAGVHCENKGLIEALVAEERDKGHLDTAAHPVTRPALVEAEAIARLLKISKLADQPIIVVHLSSQIGYQEIERARASGQQVLVETCPQYLLMDESRYLLPDFEGAKYLISPPLRQIEDQNALWQALRDGHIQTLATDHCSFTLAQKAAGREDVTKTPGGMPGVENRPALIYTYGVQTGQLTLEQMCCLLSENAAKLYGVYPQKGAVLVGSDADLVIWDPQKSWTMSVDNQVSVCDYSPFEGMPVGGKAESVFLRGELVAQDGQVIKENGGRFVKRKQWQPVS